MLFNEFFTDFSVARTLFKRKFLAHFNGNKVLQSLYHQKYSPCYNACHLKGSLI
ncbi:hypothetical protein PMAG_a2087 [Pseudoalteromonas mariniglutinosa NCIMB 1770]|nr:hypothetical protein [Pseudoalteromonas mariniglutinosa NCIMB 1770]